MFFIAGVQPKTKTLDKNARICPDCGLKRAHYQRVDHYVSLFFVPLLRVKKGLPVLICDGCRQTVKSFSDRRCRACNNVMEPGFKYCPYCGEPAN